MTKQKKSQLDPAVKRMFTGTEVGALLEDVDQKLVTIIEGQQTIDRKLDSISKDVHHLDKRVTQSEIRLDTIEPK